ncbi:RagB/SusD family nutrient uptake outer membrane protein [Sunxiuqinia sp. sy24]|uniref:RagB/SusD family nutrient uptake outer membrane protein n=1 Tax=Sunxiuqinia sp. sy24 TaxID=3461495 RepID=UPI0040461057
MKNIKYCILVLCLTMAGVSCDHEKVLTEVPKDFLSPENSFTTKAGFESALAHIYLSVRDNFYANTDSRENYDMLGMDVDIVSANNPSPTSFNEMFKWGTFNADNGYASKWWSRCYDYIFKANVIIARAESDVVEWISEDEKNAIVGEAKFLRAFAYRFLANMYGGVPLVLEETSGPKFDYERATQEAIYKQCKDDLTFATQWMPTADQLKGGRAPRAAAYHLLSEILIQMGDYQGAIDAASAVINDPAYSLMTERFGKYKDFQFNGYDYQGESESWGDVYWDLFRDGNFNRSEGNNECIWNVQFDVEILGGGNVGQWGGNFVLERWWGPVFWNLKDKNGKSNYLKDVLGGRPVGWGTATDYLAQQVWDFKGDFDKDIRNSKYNIQRTYYWTNPESEFYGQPITPDNLGTPADFNKSRVSPHFKKNVTAVHYGQFQDATSKEWHDNGRIYKDWYIMRLAETYLLRAEAYHLKGENQKAADDINVVRNRAQATPVNSGDVNIDLILDERARELHVEEYRLNTLLRMGKLTEYLMKYNEAVIYNGYSLGDHLNKFPIPNSEIEANKENPLEQNSGY